MPSVTLRLLMLLITSMVTLPAAASPEGSLFPHIVEPEGVECVQPEEEMRRNHMEYILHQRDETVYRGIRANIEDTGYSLAECIDCHVFPNEYGEIASHKDKEHFCTSCHQYASVQIDCFSCHADKPQKYIQRKTAGSYGTDAVASSNREAP